MKLREFENDVLHYFIESIPTISNYTQESFDGYNADESIGLYILMTDIFKYFEDCVKRKDAEKAREFIIVLNQFRDKYKSDYEKLCKESMDNFIAVAFYEDVVDGFEEDEIRFVYGLFNDRFKEEFNKYQDACKEQLLNYIAFLLKDEKLQLDIKYVDFSKYKFVDKTNSEKNLKITTLISITKNLFYARATNTYCYLGVLNKDVIKLLHKAPLPLRLFQNINLENFK